MLLQNQSLLAQYPFRQRGGAVSLARAMWGRGDRVNAHNGTTDATAAVPNGHLRGWLLPQRPGGMSAYSENIARLTGAAAGAQGINGVAAGAAVLSGSATGKAVALLVATGAATLTGTATGIGVASFTASGSAALLGSASASAIASMTGTGGAVLTGAAVPSALGFIVASTVQAGLTADQIAAAVWAAGLTYPANTMGAELVKARKAAALAAALSA
jgi:hypothetical protein